MIDYNDKHDWIMSDLRFELEQIWKIKKMLKKHPDDYIGELFRDMLKMCEKSLSYLKKDYKKTYGGWPNLILMRREVESC